MSGDVAITQLMDERNSTHGAFSENAGSSQSIKVSLRGGLNWHKLTLVQKESLEMIATKISRILSGNANHVDHWDDISGYAQLAAKELRVPAE